MQKPKVYLAAPFFNEEQVALVEVLEALIIDSGWRMFSPRRGKYAYEMNELLRQKARRKVVIDELVKQGVVTASAYDELQQFDPPEDLRLKVFNDNWTNIDDADLVLAVIDNFDVGAMWEIGYAFARHVPIVTHTGRDYGCNLMLAHSIVGHTKSIKAVTDVLLIGNPSLSFDRNLEEYGDAIARIQQKYKSDFALKEGPNERAQ